MIPDKLFVQLIDCEHPKIIVWNSGIVNVVRCVEGHSVTSRQRKVKDVWPGWMMDFRHLSGVVNLMTGSASLKYFV